jgi:hypothetical protein
VSALTPLASDSPLLPQELVGTLWHTLLMSEVSGGLAYTLYDCGGQGGQLLAAAHAEG